MSHPPDIVLFFGRLHPLLVHLPIGLLLLLAALEFFARYPRYQKLSGSAGFILALAVPLAIGTAVCGWLLSLGGGYESRLLQWHKWSGIAVAAICALTALFYRLDLKKAYRLCLFSNVLVLAIAGHFGGSLTHGSDYMTRYAPAPLRALLAKIPGLEPAKSTAVPAVASQNHPVDPKELTAFSLVQPILQDQCVSCHGPEKSKGSLRLDSVAGIMKGSEDGPVVVSGKADASEMIKRLKLPMDDQDHMPPEGKTQPSSEDIALLQWWIDAGAPSSKKFGELNPPLHIQRLVASRFGPRPPEPKMIPPRPLAAVAPLAEQIGEALGIPIGALSQTEPWIQCNASVAGASFGDAQLGKLAPLGPNLRVLNLAGTGVSDAGLKQLAAFPNLIRLHLERSPVSDAGLNFVAGLPQLEYLDLYGTKVTDKGLDALQNLASLKHLFLWQTQVTPAGAKAFADAHTDKDQLQRWQDQIEQLKKKINDQQISLDLGASVAAAAPSTNPAPMNAQCPVSGKPINPAKTVLYEGVVIAFCCDDCKARFQRDPKPILAKLGLSATNSPAAKPR